MSYSQSPVGGSGEVIAAPIQRDGLRRKLLMAHLTVGAVGLAMLLVALATSVLLNSNAIRLANVRGPTVSASTHTLNGIHRSLAALRGWVVLGDPASNTSGQRHGRRKSARGSPSSTH